jgi:hypothetical protein
MPLERRAAAGGGCSAAVSGIYAYHRLSQISSEPAAKTMEPVADALAEQSSSELGTGINFSAIESPRELPEVPLAIAGRRL